MKEPLITPAAHARIRKRFADVAAEIAASMENFESPLERAARHAEEIERLIKPARNNVARTAIADRDGRRLLDAVNQYIRSGMTPKAARCRVIQDENLATNEHALASKLRRFASRRKK